MKILGIICARGGSKSVPKKNIKKILGTPLIAYTIETALKCIYIDRLIVSTDDKEIAKIAKKYGAEVPFIRPKHLARDTTATAPVVEHAIAYLNTKKKWFPEIIVLLDPTSPLRSVNDIEKCIFPLINKEADAAISVCIPHENPYFNMFEYKSDKYIGIIKKLKIFPKRRQDAPKVFWANSSVFAIKTKLFMKEKGFYPRKTIPIIMPESRSFHIDSEFDFKLLEMIMKNERFI